MSKVKVFFSKRFGRVFPEEFGLKSGDAGNGIWSPSFAFIVLVAFIVPVSVWFAGCGEAGPEVPAPEEHQTRIHGTITVDATIDQSGDYSGIGVYVLDMAGAPDTLFSAITAVDGSFDGTAHFPGAGFYELHLHRNQRRLADTTLILAHQDTVQILGILPRFPGRAHILSTENEAMRTLTRLERQFHRILQIAASGGIAQDTIPHIVQTWSTIFWDIFDRWPETIAAKIAAQESLQMLEDHNDDLLMQRLREYGDYEVIRQLAADLGFLVMLRRGGLDAGMAWIDSLEAESTSRDTRLQIARNRIVVLYDSSRIEDARLRIRDFQADFHGDAEAGEWLKVIRYDVEHLSPGQPLPPFPAGSVELLGDDSELAGALSLDDLRGAPAMIEVVSLADRMYQASYMQLRTLNILFQRENIRFLTIPIETSPVAVSAFYYERGQDWPVARAGVYAESDLQERWNIYEMPVRFLIDSEGQIIRKFHGHNFNALLIELNRIVNNGEIS